MQIHKSQAGAVEMTAALDEEKRRMRLWSVLFLLFMAFVALLWRTAPAHAADSAPQPAALGATVAQGDGTDHGGPGGGDFEIRFYGKIVSMPEGGGEGAWVVDSKSFTATATTVFEEENGPLEVGACVKVKANRFAPEYATKIATEPASDCGGPGNGCTDGSPDVDHHPGDDCDHDDVEFYGRIVTMPEGGGEGTWVVDSRTFTATATTVFEQDHGGFDVGVCIEVKADFDTPDYATKIETESDYKCNGHDDDDDGHDEFDGVIWGKIDALPATPDLTGEWKVAGITFTVTTTTELVAPRVPFTVGVTVKVEFYEDNGERVAQKVKSLFRKHGHDDHEGRYGHAWGVIDSFPEGYVGLWVIGGTEYTVTTQTKLVQHPAPFAVGAKVKVKFFLNEEGKRVALRVQTTNGNGGVGDGQSFKFVGFVEQKPIDSLIGLWIIAGERFSTTATTVFKEDDGLLTEDVWVQVKYQIIDGQRIVLKMETDVPPGCGDHDHMGRIEEIGDDSVDSASLAPGAALWKVGGQTYVVTPSTDLDDAQGVLEVGSTAVVNSYTAADGSQVATRISGMDVAGRVYLPITTR